MLSSLRLAITRPAFAATRAFSATPIVKDDLFMRGLPFHWEHRDLEQFLQEQDVKFDRISLPKSDRRPTGNRGYAFVTIPPADVDSVIALQLEVEGRPIQFKL